MKYIVSETGLEARDKNPHEKDVPNCPNQIYEVWQEFEESVKTYPLTQPMLPGSEIEGELVWQLKYLNLQIWNTFNPNHYASPDEYKSFDDFSRWLKKEHKRDTRQAIQPIITQPEKVKEDKPAPIWYDEMSIDSWLTNQLYHTGIKRDTIKLISKLISGIYADELQRAYSKGWEQAFNNAKDSGTFDYVYYPKTEKQVNKANNEHQHKATIDKVVEVMEAFYKKNDLWQSRFQDLLTQIKEI